MIVGSRFVPNERGPWLERGLRAALGRYEPQAGRALGLELEDSPRGVIADESRARGFFVAAGLPEADFGAGLMTGLIAARSARRSRRAAASASFFTALVTECIPSSGCSKIART